MTTAPPLQIEQLVGHKVKAHFDGQALVVRLEHVDFNSGVLTLRTKDRLFFVPIDSSYLELPVK